MTTWLAWQGVYIGMLIIVARQLHLKPLTAGIFGAVAYFVASVLFTRRRLLGRITLISLGLACFVALVWPSIH